MREDLLDEMGLYPYYDNSGGDAFKAPSTTLNYEKGDTLKLIYYASL
jgi:hypothetical protein